ncbi:MAG: glycosyltransferase family 2 protein, partial [Desulfobacteraceae bacterium]|nr:glycosyltransferase family 2 protein [Desulfobacteraceae bacterium]
MEAMLLIAVTIFIIMAWLTLDIALGSLKLGSLGDIGPTAAKDAPLVSIIVPACNEAETIAPALATLLAQDYVNLEIVVVNDRSTDGTGEILREMQLRHPELIVLDIDELPEGWLGKHHALHCGAALAKGDILLFTDADIHMQATTVGRAVNRLEQTGLDHLCLIFKNKAKGWLLNSLILDAGSGLFLLFKPWLAGNPRSKRFMGVGAFNMVRRRAYEQVGGHAAIKTHPIDDLMLGKIIKEAGLRQECLSGYDFVTVDWYNSTGAMIDGLMKNIFALANFNTVLALSGVLGLGLLTILPQWGLLFAHGPARLFFGLTVALRLA